MSFLDKLLGLGAKASYPSKYQLVERQIDPETIVSGVRVTDGPLTGMVFTVSPSVEIKESNGETSLKYSYVVQIPPKNFQDFDKDSDIVKNTVGDIIIDIISKNYKEEHDSTDFKSNS